MIASEKTGYSSITLGLVGLSQVTFPPDLANGRKIENSRDIGLGPQHGAELPGAGEQPGRMHVRVATTGMREPGRLRQAVSHTARFEMEIFK